MIKDYLPWLLSALTIYMTYLAGNHHPRAWLCGALNQFLWLVWIVAAKDWGFLPMNLTLSAMYIRNHIKWNKNKE